VDCWESAFPSDPPTQSCYRAPLAAAGSFRTGTGGLAGANPQHAVRAGTDAGVARRDQPVVIPLPGLQPDEDGGDRNGIDLVARADRCGA